MPTADLPNDGASPLVVGFDLDMTLIDSRHSVRATLAKLAAETGAPIDIAQVAEHLGPPLEKAAAVTSLSVTTGSTPAEDLWAAGAAVCRRPSRRRAPRPGRLSPLARRKDERQ